MNNARRDQLRGVVALLDRAVSIISNVSDAEENALDNVPENLQDSERCEKMEEALNFLDSAVEDIESAKDHIESVITA